MGKCVPLRPPRVGCTFRKAPQRETTSHSKGKFRDAFFESLPIRKARPTLDASGHGTIDLSGLPSIKRRPPGRRGTKFIASSARKEGHLMWPSSCAGLPEQAIKYIAGAGPNWSRTIRAGNLIPLGLSRSNLSLRQRNTAKPAPAHARASAVEPNERVKRPRRDGALVTHNDAAANVDAHVAIDQARYAGTAMR